MLVFDYPKVINHLPVQIVRHLFHVQMGMVNDVQSGVAVIATAEGCPRRNIRHERVLPLTATG